MRRNLRPHDPVAAIWSSATPLAGAVLLLLSVEYFYQSIALANRAPVWMDEALALWTARQPSVPLVLSALNQGAEFSPPTYDLLLHMLIKVGADNALVLRFPSIIAGYITAIALVFLVKKRANWPLAALAAGIILASGLFGYAVQARPYACEMAAFACTLALWDRLPDREVTFRRTIPLFVLLVLTMSLQFYAVLLLGALGLAELCRPISRQGSIRPLVVAVIAVAGASLLLWWPILHAASTMNQADTETAQYYAKPIFLRLALTYSTLLGGLALPLGLMAATVAIFGKRSIGMASIGTLGLILCLLPVGVFVFAKFVTHSYSDRYALALVIGIALLATWLTARLGPFADIAGVALLALLAIAGIGADGGEIGKTDRLKLLAVAEAAPGSLPIVTGDGLRFFEVLENSPPAIAQRLRYVDLPGATSADPTNRHQVERWKAIRPLLPVVGAMSFVCATPAFLVLIAPHGGPDDLPQRLRSLADFSVPPGDDPSLNLAKAKPCLSH